MQLQKVGSKGRQLLIVIGVITILQGCSKSDSDVYDGVAWLQKDIETIQTYLDANGIDAEMDSTTGVFYSIHNNGSGYKTVFDAPVEINFRGSTIDGVEFVNTFNGSPISISLGSSNAQAGVTNGLILGLLDTNEGDSMTIYVPSPWGYASDGYSNVPPNTILIYQSKLIKIENLEDDYAEIDDFIANKNWSASIEPDYGIRYVVHRPGDQNVKAEDGDAISLHYQGELLNGTVFDSSIGKSPLDFILGSGSVIVGFEVGVSQLYDQDSATIFIPSVYGYGPGGSGTSIPPNTPLLFGLEMLTITKNP